MDWSPEPVAILYSTQLYDRPPNKLAPVTAEPDPPDDVPDDVPTGAAVVWAPPLDEAAGLELEHPAIATAITTSMIAIRLV
jgi:hypothetical protein